MADNRCPITAWLREGEAFGGETYRAVLLVCRACCRRVRGSGLSPEDLVSEVYLSLGPLASPRIANPKGLVYTTGRNLLLQRVRQDQRRDGILDGAGDGFELRGDSVGLDELRTGRADKRRPPLMVRLILSGLALEQDHSSDSASSSSVSPVP